MGIETGSKAWYLKPKAEVGRAVRDMADALIAQDTVRLQQYDKYVMLYGGTRASGLGLTPGQRPAKLPSAGMSSLNTPADAAERLLSARTPARMNVCKAATDTLVSKVGKARPRPTFLTTGGDWSLQRRAKNLQKFVDGAYHQADVYEHGLELFRDGLVVGTGVLLPYTRGVARGKPRMVVDRVPAWEFFVEEADAEYGEPRCLYRVRWVSRERVRLTWPAAANAGESDSASDGDFVRVVEAWFRPLDPKDEPERPGVRVSEVPECGRHVLVIEDHVQIDEYYAYADFPAVFFHWTKPTTGFWGPSALREVEGIQVEINRLLDTIQRSMRLVGQPWLLIPNLSNKTPDEFTNKPALEVHYDGPVPPTVVTHQAVHPQLIQHLWELWAKAFEILGSNQLAASATAPAGMESARGLERLSEEHSERFLAVSRVFEDALGQQLARRFLRLAKQADADMREAGHAAGFVIRAPGSRRASIALRWSEVEIDSDAYILQQFPSSALPTTPSARTQEVERWQQNGWVTEARARKLLDFPDLDEANDLATADEDALAWQFERMLERGEDVLPEPFQDLNKCVVDGQLALLRAQQDGCPESNLEKLRAFVMAAVRAIQASEEAAAAQAAAAAPPPDAGAPPMSAPPGPEAGMVPPPAGVPPPA